MKKLKWIALILVALVIVVIIGVVVGINGIVRAAVETGATNSLNLQTTLGGANISFLGGSVGLSDLEIASPQGFAAPKMFMLGGVHLGVSVSNLRADPIGIDQIKIDKPHLVIEQSGGKFNFQVLMQQPSKEPAPTGKPGESQPIRLVIHDLQLNDAQVSLRPGIPGLQQEINVNVPSVEMKDVGSGEGNKNGAAIKEVVMDVISALVKKAADDKRVPPEVKVLLTMNADELKQQIGVEMNKEVNQLEKQMGKKVGEDTSKRIGDVMKNGLGGLMGGSKATSQPK